MKKYVVLFVVCLAVFLGLQTKASAEQSEVAKALFEYVGEVIEPNSPVIMDPKTIKSETLDGEDAAGKGTIHERAYAIDKAILKELKRQSERLDSPKHSFDGHMPDLPDAADDNSQGIGRPHTVVTTTVANFPGIDNSLDVPDPTIAAGPSNIVVAVNKQIAVYKKDGSILINPITFNSWFSSVGTSGMSLYDPWLVYDQGSRRFFFLVSGTGISTEESYLYLSVSTSSDAAGTWCYNRFAKSTASWHDYGKLGVNTHGVYLTSNKALWPFGDPNGPFNYAVLRAYRKDELTSCQASPSSWIWSDLRNADYTKASTVQPALTIDSPGAEYFVNARAYYNYGSLCRSLTCYDGLTLWRATWSNNIPTLEQVGTLQVPWYFIPPDATQKDSSDRLDTHDGRLVNVVVNNGSLWTTHTVAGQSASAVRVYNINPVAMTAAVDNELSSSGVHYFNPSVMPGNGKVVLVFNRSSESSYANIHYTKRVSGTWQPTVLLKAGEGPLTQSYQSSFGAQRWGDYAGSSLDPDGVTTWLYNEYSQGDGTWGTWFAGIQ